MTLAEWRRVNGKTQRWLAGKTDIAEAAISKYERGARPNLRNALKIERATTGTDPDTGKPFLGEPVSVESWDQLADTEAA